MPSRQERRQAARQAARDAGRQNGRTLRNIQATPQPSALQSLRDEATESCGRSDHDAKTRANQDPVTIASATNEIVVPPTQQSWSCSCKYGFPDYLHLPTGIEEVWKLDRHVSRGELVGPFLNHHKYTWSGANLIHWELKAHLILGLEGSDFWVGGSKVELLREDFYEEGDQGEPSVSRDPETGRLIDWLTGGGDIGCGD